MSAHAPKSTDVEGLGDIINGTNYVTGSAADEYYKYKLLEAKLAKSGLNPDERNKVLQSQSEREAIELQILLRLSDITESSPEWAQVVDITGSRDRFEQAKRLAETVYDKVRAEAILGFYTPEKDALKQHFANRTRASAQVRSNFLAGEVRPVTWFARAIAAVTGTGGGAAATP